MRYRDYVLSKFFESCMSLGIIHSLLVLKSYFLSLDNYPLLKKFFSNSVGEMYLLFLHAQTNPFERAVSNIEREDVSVNEVK